MDPARSLLFIPGNRESWLESAHTNDADVVVLDLEDSVPPGEKSQARQLVDEYILHLREKDQRVVVRINGHPNSPANDTEEDLEMAVREDVDALMIPTTRTPEDIETLDAVMTHIERRKEIEPGSTDIILSIETAPGMRNAHELCTAADRVWSVTCGAVKGTDTARALNFEWTGPGRKGLETVHLREKVLLDARAAGVDYPLAGIYVDIGDIEGLREDMRFARQMGYTGYVVIHPSHVEHANELFSPDEEQIEHWIGAYRRLAEAMNEGKSAVKYEGEMIDTANIETIRMKLRQAKAFKEDLDIDAEIPSEL